MFRIEKNRILTKIPVLRKEKCYFHYEQKHPFPNMALKRSFAISNNAKFRMLPEMVSQCKNTSYTAFPLENFNQIETDIINPNQIFLVGTHFNRIETGITFSLY